MKRYLLIFFSLTSIIVSAQKTITLEECYLSVENNYPLAKQTLLLEEINTAEKKGLHTARLPQLDLYAQASYQSDVIKFPGELPNMSIETPNKDQYRAILEANQLIYNGGVITAQSRLKTSEMETKQQEVAVNLYNLKSRINQYYFQVFLFQEQINLLQSKRKQLEERTKEVESGVKYGMTLASSKQILQAEMLSLEQQLTELNYNRKKALESLSILIAKDINEDVALTLPKVLISKDTFLNRPELKLFELQEDQLESSKSLIEKSNYPKLMGFAQAGYGNPGLNMLDNSFQDFYLVGLRLNWNVFDWGKTKEEKQVVDISKQMLHTEKETFVLNNQMQLKEVQNDISKYEQMLLKDAAIIDLRIDVLASSTSQLQNGSITSSEYIVELNNLYEAQINQQLHEIQLLLAKANYRIIKGDLN